MSINPMCSCPNTKPMKRFKDLYIDCTQEEARAFFSRSLELTNEPTLTSWEIGKEAMARLQDNICFIEGLYSCTTYVDAGKNIASVTLVYTKKERRIWLSNIVPCQVNELTIDQYNSIFDIFCREIVVPSVGELKFTITTDTYTAIDVMSPETWKLLDCFNTSANRTSLHPNDTQRWHLFVISAFENNNGPDPSTLGRVLHEQLGWTEEQTMRLVTQYEDEIALLREYTGR